jgi:hypothetical protein
MATRCNVKIVDSKGQTQWLYRHWDGYPQETGNNLMQIIGTVGPTASPKTLTEAILGEKYKEDGRPIYETTTGQHGDIEWLYTIEFTGKAIVLSQKQIVR